MGRRQYSGRQCDAPQRAESAAGTLEPEAAAINEGFGEVGQHEGRRVVPMTDSMATMMTLTWMRPRNAEEVETIKALTRRLATACQYTT